MTRPITYARVLLVPARHDSAEPEVTPIRRYRLARLRVEERDPDPALRFEHIKRAYE